MLDKEPTKEKSATSKNRKEQDNEHGYENLEKLDVYDWRSV